MHSGSSLAIKAIKDAKPLGFVKSCIAFNEVTIPSISAITGGMNLYLETAEVGALSILSLVHCYHRQLTSISSSPVRISFFLRC